MLTARPTAWRHHCWRIAAAGIAFTALIAAQAETIDGFTYAQPAVAPVEFNGDLARLPIPAAARTPAYRPRLRPPSFKVPPASAFEPQAPQPTGAALAPMPAPTQSFAGMSKNDACTGGNCGSGWPPDTNGDVGPNHYIQAVNSSYAIYSKSGTRLAAFTEDQLWNNTVPPCFGDSQGDPVVLYDRLADRWILTHFAFSSSTGPFFQCIAVSKTGDPVGGGWYLYGVRMDPGGAGLPPVGYLNDYSKFGVWHDCLYVGANAFEGNTFRGVVYGTFSRSDMYAGSALRYALGFLPFPANAVAGMFPANDLGRPPNAVPPGTPNYFVSESIVDFSFHVRRMTAGPNCGAGGTLSAPTSVSQTGYPFVNFGEVVPQPNTSQVLDNIDDRIMQKVQYRRIGATESLWVTHNVDTLAGTTAMQWAQIDVTGGTVNATPIQQQIYAPDTTLYRWMGNLAVDGQGNMALGYSTSNGTAPNFPSIAYSGRLATDPPNTLPQTEVQLIAGAGSQTNQCGSAPCARWGDYSSMSIDPGRRLHVLVHERVLRQPGERHRRQLAYAHRLVQVPLLHFDNGARARARRHVGAADVLGVPGIAMVHSDSRAGQDVRHRNRRSERRSHR